MKKNNLIGAGIAFVALILEIFLPLVEDISLFDCFDKNYVGYALVWIIFPVFCIVCNLIGKLKGLSAWLMLIPFAWGLLYLLVPKIDPGYGVYVYGALTIVEIIWTKKTKDAE